MKFICNQCRDEINTEPCRLELPDDPGKTPKDIMVGLTMCPLEGCNYHNGKWKPNGEHYPAKWRRVK